MFSREGRGMLASMPSITAQPGAQPERPTASPLGSRRAARVGAGLALRWASDLETLWSPTYGARRYANEGGLMSYGPNFGDVFRRSGGHVDKMRARRQDPEGRKAGRPADRATHEVRTDRQNLKPAKALGITIPESILLRADEVIK